MRLEGQHPVHVQLGMGAGGAALLRPRPHAAADAANQLNHNTLANLPRAMAGLGHDDPHFVNDAVTAGH